MEGSKHGAHWRAMGHGVLAGFIFGLARCASAVALRESPLAPFRFAASVLFGKDGLSTLSPAVIVVFGLFVHVLLSALFGLVYEVVNDRTAASARSSWEHQAAVGVAYGAAVWLFDFRVVAGYLMPWLVSASPWRELVLHTLFFGLPLGVTYAASQRAAPSFTRASHGGW